MQVADLTVAIDEAMVIAELALGEVTAIAGDGGVAAAHEAATVADGEVKAERGDAVVAVSGVAAAAAAISGVRSRPARGR